MEFDSGTGGSTGNPVFDFRAGFRRAAGLAQRGLLRIGLLAILVSFAAFMVGGLAGALGAIACYGGLAGLGLLLAGVAWGFWWRHRLRVEFRDRFGTPSS